MLKFKKKLDLLIKQHH